MLRFNMRSSHLNHAIKPLIQSQFLSLTITIPLYPRDLSRVTAAPIVLDPTAVHGANPFLEGSDPKLKPDAEVPHRIDFHTLLIFQPCDRSC